MNEFIMYMDSRIEEGRKETERLISEERRDEADFAKIRTNIYDICRTVSQALMNRPGAGVQAIGAQLERFHAEWSTALEKAKQHNNVHAIAVEETKLTALDDVITHFQEVIKA